MEFEKDIGHYFIFGLIVLRIRFFFIITGNRNSKKNAFSNWKKHFLIIIYILL